MRSGADLRRPPDVHPALPGTQLVEISWVCRRGGQCDRKIAGLRGELYRGGHRGDRRVHVLYQPRSGIAKEPGAGTRRRRSRAQPFSRHGREGRRGSRRRLEAAERSDRRERVRDAIFEPASNQSVLRGPMESQLGTTNLFLGVMAAVSVLQALVLIGAGIAGFVAYRKVTALVNTLEEQHVAPAMNRVN